MLNTITKGKEAKNNKPAASDLLHWLILGLFAPGFKMCSERSDHKWAALGKVVNAHKKPICRLPAPHVATFFQQYKHNAS